MRRAVLAAGTVLISVALAGAATVDAAPKPRPKPHVVPSERCRELASAIDDTVKQMSLLQAQDIGDDSAVRATMRATQVAGKQAEIQNDIALMRATGCAPYAGSLAPSAYLIPAVTCTTALIERQTAQLQKQNDAQAAGQPRDSVQFDASLPPACVQSRWRPTGTP